MTMQKAKAFFYVSLGVLAMALAFQLGAQTAQGQAPGGLAIAGYSYASGHYVLLENGDIYSIAPLDLQAGNAPFYAGNFWGSAPTQTTETSWGRVKAERR
jgi:hypothetical protein